MWDRRVFDLIIIAIFLRGNIVTKERYRIEKQVSSPRNENVVIVELFLCVVGLFT